MSDYETIVDKARACGAQVTQHEVGFSHAEFEAFVATLSHPQAGARQAVERLFAEGARIIDALISKSDCSLDRNQEFFDAGQWKGNVRATLAATQPSAAPGDGQAALTDEKWYAVLSPNRNQGVIFKDKSDADWTAQGHRQFGVPTIGEAFREAYERDAKQFTMLEVAAPGAATAAREQEITKADVLRVAKEVGLVGWVSDCGEWFEFTETQQPSKLLIQFAEHYAAPSAEPFQPRVKPWLLQCFGEVIANDREERNHRFLEEALELVQACGCTASEAHQLVDYTFGRAVGEKTQEVGGVMVTLAALCLANGMDMREAGEVELARIWTMVEKIRAKQAAKPKHSPLPIASEPQPIAGGISSKEGV